jgi:hypothetical protein
MNSFSEKRQSNYMLVKSVNYYSEMAVIAWRGACIVINVTVFSTNSM